VEPWGQRSTEECRVNCVERGGRDNDKGKMLKREWRSFATDHFEFRGAAIQSAFVRDWYAVQLPSARIHQIDNSNIRG
jgi:hypothetical protein